MGYSTVRTPLLPPPSPQLITPPSKNISENLRRYIVASNRPIHRKGGRAQPLFHRLYCVEAFQCPPLNPRQKAFQFNETSACCSSPPSRVHPSFLFSLFFFFFLGRGGGAVNRAATTDKKASKNWGNLVLAVDPELMGDRAEFTVSSLRLNKKKMLACAH